MTLRDTTNRIVLGITLFSFPLIVAGALTVHNEPPESVISKEGILGIFTLYNRLTGWMWGILLALAIIFIVYSAFLFLTCGGEEEKLRKAKAYLIYAVVAVAIGILATGIVALVGILLGPATPPPPPPAPPYIDI